MLETVLLATLVPVAYVVGFLLTARLHYQKVRPSKVPLCGKEEQADHEHIHLLPTTDPGYRSVGGCYRRHSTVDTEKEAVEEAVCLGIVWPIVTLYFGARAAIMARPPEFPAEKEARLNNLRENIAKLEAK